MLSSCLTPQYNVCSLVVLRCPPYLMVPITASTYWYDNYGLAILQLQDLMQSWQFVGLLMLGMSALITAITSVTVAATSLTQQVHSCSICQYYVQKCFFSPTYARDYRQDIRNEVRHPRKSSHAYWNLITGFKSKANIILSCWLLVDLCNTPRSKWYRL